MSEIWVGNTPSHKDEYINQIFKESETAKKHKYDQRIMQVEKATFFPLIFSTADRMASVCTKFYKKVAVLVSNNTKEGYSHVMSHLRTRLRFTLLKSTLVAIHGERGKSRKLKTDITGLSVSTILNMPSYEV